MEILIDKRELVYELDHHELVNTEGGIIKTLEFGILVVSAAYGAGYAIGEFVYNITH
ncbi:class IIb bacteriocin, lactobin A/cerein 7B family [Sphingobacterium thalpophilum]|uniref:class IIb bacteriocin, lactobin A/cerein 7B family n=1 Tax=Sphingobacterium thalpophilum TaxID=259 RepID=UPI003C70EAD3